MNNVVNKAEGVALIKKRKAVRTEGQTAGKME